MISAEGSVSFITNLAHSWATSWARRIGTRAREGKNTSTRRIVIYQGKSYFPSLLKQLSNIPQTASHLKINIMLGLAVSYVHYSPSSRPSVFTLTSSIYAGYGSSQSWHCLYSHQRLKVRALIKHRTIWIDARRRVGIRLQQVRRNVPMTHDRYFEAFDTMICVCSGMHLHIG